MNRTRAFALAVLTVLTLSWTAAQAGVYIGVGVPGPYYRPYYRRPYYYGPRIVVVPPPVVIGVAPAPVVVAPAPVYVAPAYVAPAPVFATPAATSAYVAPVAQPGAPPPPTPIGN